MGKINILTKDIFNRIAAGEVIERPYSAVKELVENSLDADATEISVYIEKGGKQLIKVCDNGSGIEQDDLRKAFIPHATSKISKVTDLDVIKTLGFRGEALASIASISVTEIVSATEGNPAFKVVCEDGYTGKVEPAALGGNGTEVTVHNLFYNTPARLKFLKTEKSEESDIQNFISRFILGNPHVAFRYFSDGKLKLESFGNGLDEAVAQVYGAKVISQCYKIEAEKHGIRLHGYIGNQNFFKPNKSYQSLYLNGRYIVNNIISSAITNAYSAYAMKRQYPFYVLFVDVPGDMVDVNVHPNKADVRFADGRAVYGAVYSVVSSILDGTAKAVDFVVDYSRQPEIKSTIPLENSPEDSLRISDNSLKNHPVRRDESLSNPPDELFIQPERDRSTVGSEASKVDYSVYENYEEPKFDDRENNYSLYAYYNNKIETNRMAVSSPPFMFKPTPTEKELEQERKAEQGKFRCHTISYKGNLFNTYLIYEIENHIYIVDQHAAHERIIYDRLKKKIEEKKVSRQGMLVPYILSASAGEYSFIEENIYTIRDMGFDIEPFGSNAFRVCEVPVDLKDLNFKEFFDELLSDITNLKTLNKADLLKDKIAMMACKHAIKGGMELTRQEAESLLEEMNGDMGLKCPHGRPVAVRLTKYQIEKMFKRIV